MKKKHKMAITIFFVILLLTAARYYLYENFFNVLSAVFVAFLGRVAVYLLRTVESSGLLYAAGGNFNNHDQK